MEQVRLLLAIGLSFLVLFVWSMFFVDRQPKIDTQESSQTQRTIDEKMVSMQADSLTAAPTRQGEIDAIKPAQAKENPAREIIVDTPLYTVRISAKGASFTSYILKKFRESVEADAPNKELIPKEFKKGVFRTSLLGKSLNGLDEAIFSIDRREDRLVVGQENRSLTFKWVADNGTILQKTYTFDPDSYLIDLKVDLENASQTVLSDQLVLSVRTPVIENKGYGFVGPSGLIDDKLEQIKVKKIPDQDEYKGAIKWISVEDRYFLSSIIPEAEINGSMKLAEIDDVVVNQLVNPMFALSPGTRNRHSIFCIYGT